jgi:undecaprenyl phosphate-alpha-L-ara4N flippase subunit ArnE
MMVESGSDWVGWRTGRQAGKPINCLGGETAERQCNPAWNARAELYFPKINANARHAAAAVSADGRAFLAATVLTIIGPVVQHWRCRMFHHRSIAFSIPKLISPSALVVSLIVVNLAFNILANASFRVSALSSTWRGLLMWQVIGNLAGFATVITLTWLLRYMPLSVAFPLTTGLTVLGVQFVAASWIFGEPISERQWLGTLALVIGIWLIGR